MARGHHHEGGGARHPLASDCSSYRCDANRSSLSRAASSSHSWSNLLPRARVNLLLISRWRMRGKGEEEEGASCSHCRPSLYLSWSVRSTRTRIASSHGACSDSSSTQQHGGGRAHFHSMLHFLSCGPSMAARWRSHADVFFFFSSGSHVERRKLMRCG